jgi:hypothetical protein
MNKFFEWFKHFKEHNYCICYVPNEGVDFTMINTEMWGKLNDNEEARKIIDKYIQH